MTPPTIKRMRSLGLTSLSEERSSFCSSGLGTLTFAAFSSPTSISTLIISSLRVGLFHLSNGTREVSSCLVKAVECGNLVVVGAGQRILRLNDFNVVGDAGAEAVASLIDFFFGQLNAEIGDLHFVARGFQVQQG